MILKMLQPIVVIGVLFRKQICQTALGWFSNLHGQISDFHSGFLRSFKNRCLVRHSPIQKRGEKKKKGRRMVMSGLWATWKSMGRENVHFSKVKSSRARRGHPSRSYDENGKKFRSVSKRERISTIMLLELKCASTFRVHPRSVHCPLSFYWNILYIHIGGESC